MEDPGILHTSPTPRATRTSFSTPPRQAKACSCRLSYRESPGTKRLTTPKGSSKHAWQPSETKALVQFVALHKDIQSNQDTTWPGMRATDPYWREAAKWVAETTRATSRNAGSIRSKLNKLRQRYASISEAETAFGLDIDHYLSHSSSIPEHIPQKTAPSFLQNLSNLSPQQLSDVLHQSVKLLSKEAVCQALHDILSDIPLPTVQNLISQLFAHHVQQDFDSSLNLLDALVHKTLSLDGYNAAPSLVSLHRSAMKKLDSAQKPPYLVEKFARCIVDKRPHSDDSLMPLDRMPFGLLQYQIEFFTASHTHQVEEPTDFRMWRETMANEGEGRIDRIFRGPMWSGLPATDYNNPQKAKVNIASVSLRTVQLRASSSTAYTTSPDIQPAALAALSKTTKRVWLKADGTDIKVALQESKTTDWNGDVDLRDGKLQALRAEYEARRQTLRQLVQGREQAVEEAMEAIQLGDLPHLQEGIAASLTKYNKKLHSPNCPRQSLLDSCWDVAEYNILLQQAKTHLNSLGNLQALNQADRHDHAKGLYPILSDYLKDVFKKKRSPATHILVILASDEERQCKPYSVPVQYVPYHSIRDQYLRDLTTNIKRELMAVGVLVVGTVTDGEFCSLRSQGNTRPLHIWQLVHDAREVVHRMGKKTLESMLFPVAVTAAGEAVVEIQHPAITQTVLKLMIELQSDGLTRGECVREIRQHLIPDGFQPHNFRRHTPESHLDRLRTIVGTFIFRKCVKDWKQQGVDFSTHLYIPEVDPVTHNVHHDRSDHGHLLKRIAAHTREGRYPNLTWQSFCDCLADPAARLTEAALSGARKQSVSDAERLLSYHVADSLSNNGHPTEAEYVRTVAGWHEATDGRGLTEEERSTLNRKMMAYICHDLMPWYHQNPDFAYLDINRPMDEIRGFSRETFVEVTTNIESQEFKRCEVGLPPEHPRASTSDDCETFFSMCHRSLGPNFTLREFKFGWQKLVCEFTKRMDKSLPFFYWTPSERYTEEESDYNDQTGGIQRLHNLPRSHREDASVFTAARQHLPARHRLTIRQQVHRFEVNLPEVPPHLLPALN